MRCRPTARVAGIPDGRRTEHAGLVMVNEAETRAPDVPFGAAAGNTPVVVVAWRSVSGLSPSAPLSPNEDSLERIDVGRTVAEDGEQALSVQIDESIPPGGPEWLLEAGQCGSLHPLDHVGS